LTVSLKVVNLSRPHFGGREATTAASPISPFLSRGKAATQSSLPFKGRAGVGMGLVLDFHHFS